VVAVKLGQLPYAPASTQSSADPLRGRAHGENTMSEQAQKQYEKLMQIGKAPYHRGNSQLLIDYREALIEAFALGEEIKRLYNIVPPKVIFETDFVNTTHRDPKGYPMVHLALQVN
jgi:hypothetical protein